MGLSLCRRLFDSSTSRTSPPPLSPSSLSPVTPLSTAPSMRLSALLHSPPVVPGNLCSLWSISEKSPHLQVSDGGVCVWRQPVEQSSDAIRSSGGIRAGLHLWEVAWEAYERGSHALIGISTRKSPWQASGYTALVGRDSQSWGWELSSNELWHKGKEAGRYPAGAEHPVVIPERVVVAVDADAGTLGYLVEGRYLGVAFADLPKGEDLFLAVSCVWGRASIRLRYLGGMSRDPPSLMSLCSLTIHQTMGRSRVSLTDRLPLPPVLQRFLQAHQWPVSTSC
ncbi:SPRY domain-containing SOCS box protein 2 [Clupea harengus]|uniref:SPRY domain-containing SOCS box protein 2 n=1 Tax=Clupea harengus TaxID=7950 RepID=A0A6P3VJP6_CLUHA|nr:SPRY domain-containing SOCS box protein 2 [Clupea harengus]